MRKATDQRDAQTISLLGTSLLLFHGGDVTCFDACHVIWCGGHVIWCDVIACVMSCHVMQCDVMWCALMWCALQWSRCVFEVVLWRCGDPKYYSVLQSSTVYYKVLLQYYSVLQSTTPVLLQYYFLLKRWPNGEVNEIRTRYERDPMIPKHKMLKDSLLEELLDSKIARASLPRISACTCLKMNVMVKYRNKMKSCSAYAFHKRIIQKLVDNRYAQKCCSAYAFSQKARLNQIPNQHANISKSCNEARLSPLPVASCSNCSRHPARYACNSASKQDVAQSSSESPRKDCTIILINWKVDKSSTMTPLNWMLWSAEPCLLMLRGSEKATWSQMMPQG